MSTRQFHREASIVVGAGGKGLLIEKLRIQFDIIKTLSPSPNPCTVKIFNLNPTHEAQIKNEFTDIIVNAGYRGATRLIFRGNIKYVYRYKSGQNFVTEISAGDGDADYQNSTINVAMAAGTTTAQLIDKCVASFSSTIKGSVTLPSDQQHIRARVVTGNTRHILHRISRENGANWSIQDGALDIVPTNALLPYEAIAINMDTGLLGAPEVNEKGITVKCLLNPQVRVNGAIQLDNNNIKLRVRRSRSLNNSPKKVQTGPVRLDPDGIYKVVRAEYHGDTRGGGGTWRNDLICLALGAPVPAADQAPDPGDSDVAG